MKTLIEKSTRMSKYVFKDDVEVIITAYGVSIPSQYLEITDMNESNSELLTVTDVPEDWDGHSYMYTHQWIKLTGLEGMLFDDAIPHLYNILSNLRKHLSATINECVLVNDPAPQELKDLVSYTRLMYKRGKKEISELTEENYKNYVLVGPEVKQLLKSIKSFL